MLLLWAASLGLAGATPPDPPTQAKTPVTSPAPTPQSGPAHRLFEQWLAAFNSGDPEIIKAFYAKHTDDPDAAFTIENAQDSCGLDVERVKEQTALSMSVILRERCYPGLQRLKIELEAADSVKVKTLKNRPLPLPDHKAMDAISGIADRLTARDAFAGSLIVTRNDKTLLARSWGLANKETKAPVTLDTPMFLASAGKMFTAVATLQLVEAGKIDLDAPFGTYLTDYPNAGMAKATIRQLLNHRGGTGDIGILGRDDGANRAWVRTIDDIVKLNGSRAPDFPPGTKTDYSNYGFMLLGAVIDKVTGQSYYDYIAEHVFKPAGMTNAGFPDLDHLQDVAVGYTTFFGAEPKLVSNLGVLPWRGAAAGGGVASANDMLHFFRALKAGKLLSPAMFKQATTPGATDWYGLGFVLNDKDGYWGHGGTSYGMDIATGVYGRDDTIFICMGARDMVCNRLIYAYYLRTYPPSD